MRKLIVSLLKSKVGKAIVEILLNAFISHLEKKGVVICKRIETAGLLPHIFIPVSGVMKDACVSQFCKSEIDNL